MEIPRYCILCDKYKQHPCNCTHCEDFDEFKMSESGKHLISTIRKECKGERIDELEKLKIDIAQSMNIINSEFGHELNNEQKQYNYGLKKALDLANLRLLKLKGDINAENRQ